MTDFPIFDVSELTATLKVTLNEGFGAIIVRGEVGNFTAHRSGHWYFTLKDAGSVLNCVMFRGHNRLVEREPKVGDAVEAFGGLDVYGPFGRYNLVVRRLRASGRGDLQARFEALKARLQAEGLFDLDRKRPLPLFPRAVGVVTSPTGAAVADMVRVLGDRFPGAPVIFAGCRVQGKGAEHEVIAAMERVVRDGRADVILVGRGGGSYEDLWAFNEEVLVRAIAACPIPIVSAVGHESDVTLADLVADVRAATPSHAAELVVPEQAAVLAGVHDARQRLEQGVRRNVERQRARLIAARLRDPRQRVDDARIRCDGLTDRLTEAMGRRLAFQRKSRLARAAGALDALSPLRVLDRGYAIVQAGPKIVRQASELRVGDALSIRLAVGVIAAQVVEGPSNELP